MTHPFSVTTGGLPKATDPVRRWSLQSLAPVLPSGWALLGDLSRIVPVSPQRIMAVAPAQRAELEQEDDSVDPAELTAAGGGLAFVVLGAPSEEVDMTLVRPAQTILAMHVAIGPSGRVAVTCSAAGECQLQASSRQ